MSESDCETSSSSGVCDVDATPRKLADNETYKEPRNIFKNDGSFLEMFRQLQRESKPDCDRKASEVCLPMTLTSHPDSSTTTPLSPTPPASALSPREKEPGKQKSLIGFVGKRRGGRVLPTGVVMKQRKNKPARVNESSTSQWSQYMDEVRKYKELTGEEEGRNIPLVK